MIKLEIRSDMKKIYKALIVLMTLPLFAAEKKAAPKIEAKRTRDIVQEALKAEAESTFATKLIEASFYCSVKGGRRGSAISSDDGSKLVDKAFTFTGAHDTAQTRAVLPFTLNNQEVRATVVHTPSTRRYLIPSLK